MTGVARAVEMDQTRGFIKIVVDAETDEILGAIVLGSNGAEVVQTIKFLIYVTASWRHLERCRVYSSCINGWILWNVGKP